MPGLAPPRPGVRAAAWARLFALISLTLALGLAPSPVAAQEVQTATFALDVRPALGLESVPPGWVPVRIAVSRAARDGRLARPAATGAAGVPGALDAARVEGSGVADQAVAVTSGALALEEAEDRFIFRLSASRRGRPGDGMVVEREESIPPGAVKRFSLHACLPSDGAALVVTVHRARDGAQIVPPVPLSRLEVREPGSSRYRSRSSARGETWRILLLSDPAAANALLFLRSVTFPDGRQPLLAVVDDPGELPDRRVGFAPFDLILLRGMDLRALSPAQVEAIRAFVLGGGELLVSHDGQVGSLGHDLFRDLLPSGAGPRLEPRPGWFGLEGAGGSILTLAADGGEPLTAALPQADTLTAAEGRQPTAELARAFPAGVGRVTLLGADVAGAAVRDAPDAWRDRFSEALAKHFPVRRSSDAGPVALPRASEVHRWMRVLFPEVRAPVAALAMIAVLYVVMAGPVNFLVLRRLEREPLTLVTVPVIALFFLAGTIGGGYALQGTRSRSFEVSVARTSPGTRYAVETRYLGFLASTSTTIDAPLDDGEEAMAFADPDAGDNEVRGYTVSETRPRRVSGLALSRWETALVRAEGIADLAGGLSLGVSRGADGTPFLVARNETRHRLTQVYAEVRDADRMLGVTRAPGEPAPDLLYRSQGPVEPGASVRLVAAPGAIENAVGYDSLGPDVEGEWSGEGPTRARGAAATTLRSRLEPMAWQLASEPSRAYTLVALCADEPRAKTLGEAPDERARVIVVASHEEEGR